jgi:hypothetical protein
MTTLDQVTEVCQRLGLAVDWQNWLEHFQDPPSPRSCPECGAALKLKSGRYGEFYGCTGYPECKYTESA